MNRFSSIGARGTLKVFTFAAMLLSLPAYAASIAPVSAQNGMVVTAQHLATEVGVDVLKKGGNAIDAAVAVGYALAVVYPAAGNLGGGGFMTIQFADGRKTFLDFREKAPLAATAGHVSRRGRQCHQGREHARTSRGRRAGLRPGFETAREKYGTMSRGSLLAPAIAFAEEGFVLEQGDVDMFRAAAKDMANDPPSAKIFLVKGEAPAVGDKLVQKDLAKTLRLIAQKGLDGFYTGADRRRRSPHRARPARASSPRPTSRSTRRARLEPIECDYRGYQIVSAPPPSSGGVIICEILNVLEGYPLKDLGFRSAQADALPDRGDAPRLCGPQQLSRRSGLREESARAPARQGLRGEDPRRDRSDEGRRFERDQARRAAARRHEYDALLDRRQGRATPSPSPTR